MNFGVGVGGGEWAHGDGRLHLRVNRETAWHSDVKEGHGKFCVVRGVRHLQSCSVFRENASLFSIFLCDIDHFNFSHTFVDVKYQPSINFLKHCIERRLSLDNVVAICACQNDHIHSPVFWVITLLKVV